MNINELREAQASFQSRIEDVIKSRKDLYRTRDSFCKYFNQNKIRTMKINDFVAGVKLPKKGYNFCYSLERQLDGLGRIIGATAFKFGVYYGRTKSDVTYEYRFTKKFGNTYQEAFEKIKKSILDLLIVGKNEDLDLIAKNSLSPMFKGKILCTYYPERYLNVFSPDHLDYFLIQLDIDTKELLRKDAIYKREALISFKNQDIIMKNWSVDLFSHFLYSEYPRGPRKENTDTGTDNNILIDYQMPNFPSGYDVSLIDLEIVALRHSETKFTETKSKSRKQDYDKEAKKLKRLGDRGEKIVMEFEKERLKNESRSDLAKKVERVSLKSDSFGYDILSFDSNGKERLIEVKATSKKVGLTNFFLSVNELNKAKERDNYFIYMVYDVASNNPKVWIVGNPFSPQNNDIQIEPVNFKITINTNRK